MTLTAAQREEWERQGFLIVRGIASQTECDAMIEAVVALARRNAAGEAIAPTYIQAESRIAERAESPEDAVSKVFRVHREHEVFRRFCERSDLLDRVEDLIGPQLDCFLSQFIFKHPGAMGQPWHQDAFYFPFDRGPQVGVWLAVTESTPTNGPLWVLPGSHREPVHEVVGDRRPHANFGYVEIVDHDMSGERAVLMDAGDLLLFHSHLMHRSTDNESDRMRAAMVYHYAESGTVDGSQERFGLVPPNIDWMPVRGSAS